MPIKMRSPRLFLFNAADHALSALELVFARYSYQLESIASLENLEAAIRDADSLPDGIVVCSALATDLDLLDLLEDLSAGPITGSIPLICLLMTGDQDLIAAAYQAGADLVLPSPWNAEQLYLQTCALARRRESFESRATGIFSELALRPAVLQAFDAQEEASILLGADLQIKHVSLSAIQLLGLSTPPSQADLDLVASMADRLVHKHNLGANLSAEANALGLIQSRFEDQVRRRDEREIDASIRVTSLTEDGKLLFGFSISITSAAELADLERSLSLARASRSLCLLSTSTLLSQASQSSSPVLSLQKKIAESATTASIDRVLGTLLEVLDSVLPPDLSIRMDTESAVHVAMREADLFQLLGHMLLYAADQAGGGGEIDCSVSGIVPGEGVTITVGSLARTSSSSFRARRIAKMLEGSTTDKTSNQLAFGLHAAQQIAERYRTAVEMKQTSDLERRVRVRLPIGRKA